MTKKTFINKPQWETKMLWPRLSDNFYFAFKAFNNDPALREKPYFGSKQKNLLKNCQPPKLTRFWPIAKMENCGYRKLLNLKLFRNSFTLNLHQTREKSFGVIK